MTKEERRAYNKAYYERNRGKLISKSRSYKEDNRELLAEKQRNWARDNAEQKKQSDREYRESNKEKIASYKNHWREVNRDKYNAAQGKRRARKLNQTPDLNIAEKLEIEFMYLYNQIMPGDWHVDHIVALANGGLHHPANLQILSKFDNLSKGAR